jgi:hypothetical protein
MTTTTRSTNDDIPNAVTSVWIVILITVTALFLGMIIRSAILSRFTPVERTGVAAQVPAGWVVQNGLASEQTVFTARDPFSANQSYTAMLVPTSADTKLSDLALLFNLQQAKDTQLYRVIDQGAVMVNGKDAYKVHYAYVDPTDQGSQPVVVEGVGYIFMDHPKALVVSMEDEASQFENDLPAFMKFLETVSYTPGGN